MRLGKFNDPSGVVVVGGVDSGMCLQGVSRAEIVFVRVAAV